MGYTGYKIIQYIDENPNSSGYGQTWTERVLDTTNCPSGDSSWNLISSSCEAVTSGYTGRRINIYYNNVTGEYSSTTESDSSCTESSSVEEWVDSGDTYCEMDEDGIYTGWGIQLQVQRNSNLLNYGETREVRFSSTTCSDETNPEWETISTNCKVVADMLTCRLYFDGTTDILQIDVNPSSQTFNQTRSITGFSEDCVCEACDSVEESWSYVADYCGNQMPSEYQLSGLTDDTVYHVYRMYETCIIDGQSGRTRPTNVYSAETYQTGVSGCTERWVDYDYECVEVLTRWVEGGYWCSGTTKMLQEKEQESVDWGETWTDTGNLRSGSTVLEVDSMSCGYIPPASKAIAVYSDGTVRSKYCDSSSTLTVTEVRDEGYVTSGMTSAYVGDCVREIGGDCFYGCINLTGVTLPETIHTIGSCAFSVNYSLKRLNSDIDGVANIPSGVTTINGDAFAGCRSLTTINIPNRVDYIGSGAFGGCSSLTSIDIPNSVRRIKNSAFIDCSSLTSVTIGSGAIEIGDSCFTGCDNLSNANIKSGSIYRMAFGYCRSLTSVTLGSGVTSIGRSAFDNCTSLTSINIPNSVTSIGVQAFDSCIELTSCTIGSGVTTIGDEAFRNCSGLTSIVIPDGVETIGKNVFRFCSGLTSCTIGSGITLISEGAFRQCTSLTSIDIPNSVTSIGENAFIACTSLSSVTIPNTVTSIGNEAFGYCKKLKSVIIPSGVTSINYRTFISCDSLTSVTIPNTVTSIGNEAFDRCVKLKSMVIPDSVTTIGDEAFDSCIELTSCTIGSGVTSIGNNAFASCGSLTSIEIPSGVTSIGEKAFIACTSLTGITCLAPTPPTIGEYALLNTNDCPIYVPSGSISAYQSAWSDYSSRITGIPNS